MGHEASSSRGISHDVLFICVVSSGDGHFHRINHNVQWKEQSLHVWLGAQPSLELPVFRRA
jgi:hypothetical protein